MDTTSVAILSSVGTLIIVAVGGVVLSGKGLTGGVGSFPIVNWFKVLYYFLPYSLFLFGIIYDGLVRKIKFFPAGFVGLLAVSLSWIISRGVYGAPVIDTDICGLPGMSEYGSNLAPQNILFTSTVMSYIASYISATQSDSAYSGAAWGGVGIVFIIQLIGYYLNKCYESKIVSGVGGVKVNNWIVQFASFVPPVIGLVLGMLIGGLSGYGFSTLKGDTSGIGISSEAKQSMVGGSSPANAPTSGTPGVGKCSSTDSDDQFVCEAYKNGELVTSTIVE